MAKRKLSLLTAAIAIVALAIPALATAGTITSSAGKLAPVGSHLTITSTNEVLTTSLGSYHCTKTTFRTELTKNSGGTFQGKEDGEGTSTSCSLGSTPILFTDRTIGSMISVGAGSGTMSLSFTADLPGLTCKYTGTNMPFTYTAGTNAIRFTNASMTASPAACGTASFDGDFAVEIGSSLIIFDY